MKPDATNWPADSICLRPIGAVCELATEVYERTCRRNFGAPGFCVLRVGDLLDSVAFRQRMVDLKRALAAIHEAQTGNTLIYLSAARFDQQETTKPHRDGGPEECFLMLGYEPSTVDAELEISDYTHCAFDLGLTPQQFLARHNPLFQAGHELLRPYTTRIPCFAKHEYQIICINNSAAPFSPQLARWQGTLHTARILAPDESARRIINSTMIAPAPAGTPDIISGLELQDFIHTSAVHRRGYDKGHLEEDE